MARLSYAGNAKVVDTTIGQAGHAVALANRLGENGLLIGLDVNPESLLTAQEALQQAPCRLELVRENFGRLDAVLAQLAVSEVDVILADLGFSSAQLADERLGLSFQQDGPLDMRLDDRLSKTAADLVNRSRQEELADLIYHYGEERHSRRIARAIVTARQKGRLERAGQLVEVINAALGIKGKGRRSRIHPATRTFQALRIAVNDELGQLERLLEAAPKLLSRGGQIAVISFHSLEDRLVKKSFRKLAAAGQYELLTRKCVMADEAERMRNPRSRSAKLRVARRL